MRMMDVMLSLPPDEANEVSYLSQLLQHMFIDATLFKIDSRALDDICDDLLIDVSDLVVRHLDGFDLWRCRLREES